MTHFAIDATTGFAHNIPLSTPTVGGYVTGAGIAWTPIQFEQFHNSGIERFNQDNDTNPHIGEVFDCESRAGTPAGAGIWAAGRKRLGGMVPRIYASRSLLAAIATELHRNGVTVYEWHLADWNLNEAEARAILGELLDGGKVGAVQYESPSSNPHSLVPGSHLTLAQANVDVSVCADDWFPPPVQLVAPHGVALTEVSIDFAHADWHARPLPSGARFGHHGTDDKEWWNAELGINTRTGARRIRQLPATDR